MRAGLPEPPSPSLLIVIAHGSRNEHWRHSVERVIEAVDAGAGGGRVRVAYMELSPPTLMEVVSDGVRAGITRFRILPLFLATEGHVERDIAPLVDQVQAASPELTIDLLPPIGQHPEFGEALGRIVVSDEGSADDTDSGTS